MSEEFNVRKIAYQMPVSVELMLGAGLITEEQAREMGWTPPPPVPRLRRIRWAAQTWWWEHKPRVHFGPCDVEGDL